MNGYFSDRENGPRARTEHVISPTVWPGLAGMVQALINSSAFGLRFPTNFPSRPPSGPLAKPCTEMPSRRWHKNTMRRSNWSSLKSS